MGSVTAGNVNVHVPEVTVPIAGPEPTGTEGVPHPNSVAGKHPPA